jgi:hypothetical protein
MMHFFVLPLPIIDWTKEEPMDLDILISPIEQRMKHWVDGNFFQIQYLRMDLIYGELKDEIHSGSYGGFVVSSSKELPMSLLAT